MLKSKHFPRHEEWLSSTIYTFALSSTNRSQGSWWRELRHAVTDASARLPSRTPTPIETQTVPVTNLVPVQPCQVNKAAANAGTAFHRCQKRHTSLVHFFTRRWRRRRRKSTEGVGDGDGRGGGGLRELTLYTSSVTQTTPRYTHARCVPPASPLLNSPSGNRWDDTRH